MTYVPEAVLLFQIIAKRKHLLRFLALLEAGVLCPFSVIFDALWFHRGSPRTNRKAVFCEPLGINHLLADDDRNDVEVFIDILVNLLGVISPVQNDVSELKVRIAPLQFIEEGKNRLLIIHAGRGNDGCHGDTCNGSEAVGLVAHWILVRMMPFSKGNAFVLESPVPLVILFAFGRTAGHQEHGIGNQDDSFLPMLRQIGNLRIQQTQGVGLENEPFVDFHKALRPETFSQGIEGVVGRLDIVGDEPVKIVLSENFGQLTVRQDTFFDLDDPCQDQKNAESLWTDTCVVVDDWLD